MPNAYRKLESTAGFPEQLFGLKGWSINAVIASEQRDPDEMAMILRGIPRLRYASLGMTELFPTIPRVLTVAELTRSIRGLLETRFGAVWVRGEISNYKKHPSGHQYFTLKDQRAAIACVIFRDTLPPFPNALADGMQVQVYGNVSVFEARGQYQLSVQILQSRGLGLLQAKFEALKRKLEAEGLFDQARKRALPTFPRRIGIITSPSGAAIRDILNVLHRRLRRRRADQSGARPGAGAALDRDRDRELNAPNDSGKRRRLVVARGGGGIRPEFNEEIVARAISIQIQVVSAVGHEVISRSRTSSPTCADAKRGGRVGRARCARS